MSDHVRRSPGRSRVALSLLVLAAMMATACTSGGERVVAPDGSEVELTYSGSVAAPEFPSGLDWLNVEGELSLRDLRGKVVILDFWTQGCINCIHIIPELKRLEAEFADELVVVGVHSAKFDREAQLDAIRQSVVRYELEHPVVNDEGFAIWTSYGVNAWPTTVLIDPAGKVVDVHAGEGVYDRFQSVLATMADEWGRAGRLDARPLELVLEAERTAPSVLQFPGSVLADADRQRLFISDSNNHRILVADLGGALRTVIGGRRGAGRADGSFETAAFNRPQGLALSEDGSTLYVADLENHLIRAVDLDRKMVATVAGTGSQGFAHPVDPLPALETPLNSPWDVLVDGTRVHIAMAGQHQLWTLDTESGAVRTLAGTRREALLDGPPLESAWNQPSGLATDGTTLFVTDPEASAVRRLPLHADADGGVSTIVGTGLFDFGDRDGSGDDVRLQHAIDLAWVAGKLYVTDTYNHKIKVIDPADRSATTLAGTGGIGWADGAGSAALFAEPSGISAAGGLLYVADTNNHLIRTVDLASGVVSTLTLTNLELARAALPLDLAADEIRLDPVRLAAGDGEVTLVVEVPEGYEFNELGPFGVEWSSSAAEVATFSGRATYNQVLPEFPQSFPLSLAPGDTVLTGEATVYYCRKGQQEFCLIRDLRFEIPVRVSEGSAGDEAVRVRHLLPAIDPASGPDATVTVAT